MAETSKYLKQLADSYEVVDLEFVEKYPQYTYLYNPEPAYQAGCLYFRDGMGGENARVRSTDKTIYLIDTVFDYRHRLCPSGPDLQGYRDEAAREYQRNKITRGDYNVLDRLFAAITYQYLPYWLRGTLSFKDGNVFFPPRPHLIWSTNGWRMMSLAKFIYWVDSYFVSDGCRNNLLNVDRANEVSFDRVSAAFTRIVKPRHYVFTLESGDDIVKRYNQWPWGNSASCMLQKPQVRMYAAHPDRVSMLVIHEQQGTGKRWAGRALLWTADNGAKALDRIYPSDNGGHIAAAIEYAKGQGWFYKDKQDASSDFVSNPRIKVTLPLAPVEPIYDPGVDGLPYLDSLKYLDTDALSRGEIVISNKADNPFYTRHQGVDGSPLRMHVECINCGVRRQRFQSFTPTSHGAMCDNCLEETVSVSGIELPVHKSRAFVSARSGEWFLKTHRVYVTVLSPEGELDRAEWGDEEVSKYAVRYRGYYIANGDEDVKKLIRAKYSQAWAKPLNVWYTENATSADSTAFPQAYEGTTRETDNDGE